jgi:hypothetical protein
MNFQNSAALILSFALAGCSVEHKSTLGTLVLSDTDSFSLRASIPSTQWPSRLVWFDRVGAGMDAYSEPIYSATVATTITNSGPTAFSVSMQSTEQQSWTLAPGQSTQLPRTAFKDFRITIVPTPTKTAEVDFAFHLDRSYSTKRAWRIVAAWSDGP